MRLRRSEFFTRQCVHDSNSRWCYGKTTALATWAEASKRPCAWLSLDARDDDPARLLTAVARALPDLPREPLPRLLDALAAERLVLVLDDYHSITEPTAHELVGSLLDALPVVVATRTLPPLRLARRRAAGELAELGPAQLRFRYAEPELLLNGAFGLRLSAERLAAIDARVQGWPAGLSLVGSALAERSFDDALAHADVGGSALERALARQALADVLRAVGRHEEAGRALARAAEITRSIPGSLYHALTLVLRAELELAGRERGRARRTAAEARAIIDRYTDTGVLATRLTVVDGLLERRADDALLGSRLTRSEQRVLKLLESDLTLEAIASERLCVSINTVKSHARRLYRRLGAQSRAEAVAAARERGLL